MMSPIPFFSIITASYNSDKTIQKTIESVLIQDFTDFEYIIIDGNSNDETLNIIKSFEELFAKKNISFKYISEKDKGIYDAWNKGLDVAEGKWISFLGSDDTYIPGALKLYDQEINKNAKSINYISSKIELIEEKGTVLQVIGKPFVWKKIVRNMDIAQVGSFHKRELFKSVGKFSTEYKIVGDLDFYIRCRNHIQPAYFNQVTAKMQNGGVSNHIYTALKEALAVKQHHKQLPSYVNYYDFYLSLAKCYIKILIKKK